jgi:glycosyltransferase involved in cell wall biosynthesis
MVSSGAGVLHVPHEPQNPPANIPTEVVSLRRNVPLARLFAVDDLVFRRRSATPRNLMETSTISSAKSVSNTSAEKPCTLDLSVVLPCLNEVATLGTCIRKIRQSLEGSQVAYEIVVADNGSSDGSVELARQLGVEVLPVSRRGYGAALRAGIAHASARYVIFADSDDTYFLTDTLALYERAAADNADMAIGARIGGRIEPGAMPLLHRYLGTPVLTTLINWLFHGHLTDCNSGFRCLRRSVYETWNIRSDGMEFASELLIKALKSGAKIVEVRSGLARSSTDRTAHLSTWRDGMRHLLFILSERPQMFEIVGLLMVLFASTLQVIAAITGPIAVLNFHIFDLHSQALLLLAAITGTQLYVFSCYLYLGGEERSSALTRKLVALDEGTLFFLLLGVFVAEAAVVGFIFLEWILASFSGLNLQRMLLILIHFLTVPGLLAIGLLGVHVFKKSSAHRQSVA